MRSHRFLFGLVCFFGFASYALAQTQNEVVLSEPQVESGKTIQDNVDLVSATIFNPAAAAALLKATICTGNCNTDANDFYAIIHVVRWSDPKDPDKTQTVVAQNWYVYHVGSWWYTGGKWTQDKFTSAKRLYGARRVYFLYVHLNWAADTSKPYKARYEFQITKKTAANVQDVFLLAQLLASGGPTAASRKPHENLWGGRPVEIGLVPSDIQIDPRYVTDTLTSNRGDELSKAETFNNEGNHYWDVSVAIPLKKISDLKFDSTNNTVTPSKISTTNAFGLVDIYLPPTDLAGTNYSYIPHPIAGVALTGQPLHKILVGGAVGLNFAQFYAAALFVKQQQLTGLQTGSPATPPQLAAASHFSYNTQFSVGINLPVRGMLDALKKTKSK